MVNEIREKLILDNINLIYHILKSMGLYDKKEELYDIGLIGLVRAGNTFEESKGYKFNTYAGTCIRMEILKFLRMENMVKRKANYNTISLDTPIYNNGKDNELTVIDILISDDETEAKLIEQETKELLYRSLSKIKEKELFIINSLYGLNGYKELTQKEVAEKLNISQAQVSRIIKKALKKLKKMMDVN